MKRVLLFLVVLSGILTSTSVALSEISVGDTDVQLLSQSYSYVRFTGRARVYSMDDPFRGSIHLSLRDDNGLEIQSHYEPITVVYGQNDLTGSGSCSIDTWRQVKAHLVTVRKPVDLEASLNTLKDSLKDATQPKKQEQKEQQRPPITFPARMYIAGTAEIFERPGYDRRFRIGVVPGGNYITILEKQGSFCKSEFREGGYFWINEGYLKPAR